MPVVSRAQNAAMHAAEEGRSTLGIPQKVGAEFGAGQKPGALKGLPEKVGTRARGVPAARQEPKPRKPFGSFAP